MVGSEQNVLDTLHEIDAGNVHDPLRGRNFDPRLRRMHQRGRVRAVERLHPHQNVGDGRLQADELDALAGKAVLAGVDQPAFEQLAGKLFDRWRGDVARIVGQLQHDRQPHAGVERGAP